MTPGREFTKTEFGDMAGVTRQTVSTYADLLLKTDLYEEVPNTAPGGAASRKAPSSRSSSN